MFKLQKFNVQIYCEFSEFELLQDDVDTLEEAIEAAVSFVFGDDEIHAASVIQRTENDSILVEVARSDDIIFLEDGNMAFHIVKNGR